MSQRLLQEWALQWRGTGATFAIVPVVPSKETAQVVAPHLAPAQRTKREARTIKALGQRPSAEHG